MSQRQPFLEGSLSVATAFLLLLVLQLAGVRTIGAEEAAEKCKGNGSECEITRPAEWAQDIKIKRWSR